MEVPNFNIKDTLNINDNLLIGYSNILPENNYRLDVNGDINFNGNLYINGVEYIIQNNNIISISNIPNINNLLYYNGTEWKKLELDTETFEIVNDILKVKKLNLNYIITSISPEYYNGTLNTEYTIYGNNFNSTINVKFVNNLGQEIACPVVYFDNIIKIRVLSPNIDINNGPFKIKLIDSTNINNSILSDQNIEIDTGPPTWITQGADYQHIYNLNTESFQLEAIDPDGSIVSYELDDSSTLPTDLNLDQSSGIISGIPNITGGVQIYNILFKAISQNDSTSRNIILKILTLPVWNTPDEINMGENTFQLDATSSENGLEITYTTLNTDNNITLSTSGLITITDLDFLNVNGTIINVTATDEYGYSSSKDINIKQVTYSQWIYNLPGNYIWTCPSDITQISVLAVGGGGGGGSSTSHNGGSGGGGGGLIWVNNITVVPGNNYTIEVGLGGLGSQNGYSNGQDGGDSSFDDLLIAHGGYGGKSTGHLNNNLTGGNGGQRTLNLTNNTNYGGGNGGNGGMNASHQCGGGGGAAGYTGNGGDGANSDNYGNVYNGQDGQGGGGGGGSRFDLSSSATPGGGVGIFGQGTDGSGGVGNPTGQGHGSNSANFASSAGKSGSDGIEAINTDNPNCQGSYCSYAGISTAGKYGGGGGGMSQYLYGYSNGGNGALRIISNPNASFPTTKVSNSDYQLTYTNENGTSSAI
tara:strand:- start:199 stop:2301 length:2103 start_codon:yes stop_codon:yes gene_type:complete